jgi:hypothetical protein
MIERAIGFGVVLVFAVLGSGILLWLTDSPCVTDEPDVRAGGWKAGPVSDSRPLPPDDEGGDPACWARRVCPACGRLADEDPPTRCPACGADLPDD